MGPVAQLQGFTPVTALLRVKLLTAINSHAKEVLAVARGNFVQPQNQRQVSCVEG
jgi:hypothetical protein